MKKNTTEDPKVRNLVKRRLFEWNRFRVSKMQELNKNADKAGHENLEISKSEEEKKLLDFEQVAPCIFDASLRLSLGLENENAITAVIFLEWYEKEYQKEFEEHFAVSN